MEIFWYLLIALFVAIFFILDGYDFGTGIVHLFFAKEKKDKEVIAKAAGLFWDSNEVWLVAAGGMLFMAFPTYYASVFSGFYLPLILVLWFIIFRALGLELRNQLNNSMWHSIWDKAFGVSSLLLALFFGVALGNVVRGVNLGGVENGVSAYEPQYFFLPLWDSSFSPLSNTPGVIDWFTIIIGIISVVTLTIHGAAWVILKTNASVNEKLKLVIFKLSIVQVVLTFVSVAAWLYINPNALNNFSTKFYFLVFPLLYFIGLGGLLFIKQHKKEFYGFLFSTLLIVGGITSTLASIFPVILPSTNSVHESLTIYNTATTNYGLSTATKWAIVGVLLIVIYAIVQNRLLKGKIDNMDYGH